MTRSPWLGGSAAALVLSLLPAAPARAQQVVEPDEQPIFGTRIEHGLSLTAGGGVVGFTDGDTGDFLDVGGLWDARITWGSRARIALEAGYFGTANDVEALGLDTDAYLLGTGLEGSAVFHLFARKGVAPYAFSGLGWTRFSIENASFNNSALANEDDLVHIPVGLGFSYNHEHLLADVRAVVRSTFGEDLIDDAGEEHRLDTWTVHARVGWTF